MSHPEPAPAPARRRLDVEMKEEDPGRSGCLWLGGVLGVVAGVLFTFLAVPPLLDWAFPPERVGVGEEFAHEGLILRVASVERLDEQWRITVDVTVRKTWHAQLDDFVLHYDSGTERPPIAANSTPPSSIGLGQSGTLTLVFPAVTNGADPSMLWLDDPQVEFALPELSR